MIRRSWWGGFWIVLGMFWAYVCYRELGRLDWDTSYYIEQLDAGDSVSGRSFTYKLLYSLVVFGVWSLVEIFGWGSESVFVIVTMLSLGVTFGLMWWLGRMWGLRSWWLGGMLVWFGLAKGVWFGAGTLEDNIFVLPFVVLVVVMALRLQKMRSLRNWGLLAGSSALAFFAHPENVGLLVLPVVLLFVWRGSVGNWVKVLRALVVGFSLTGVLVELLLWMCLGEHLWSVYPPVGSNVERLEAYSVGHAGYSMVGHVGMVLQGLGDAVSSVSVLSWVLGVLLVGVVGAGWRISRLLVVILGLVVLNSLYYESYYYERWISALPILVLLVVLKLRDSRMWVRGLACLVVGWVVVSFVGSLSLWVG